ncbi:MAG TPA: hypothetical protein VG651_08610 [Stellaceae bacterium]|nr:hypothetical protein [Stellaceae bacterium]
MIDRTTIGVAFFTAEQAALAATAYRNSGKGSGRPAKLVTDLMPVIRP